MAAANARMVAASSWPYVQYSSGNLTDQGVAQVSLSLTNSGVGPARIERVEIRYDDRPIASSKDLMEACCVREPADRAALERQIGAANLDNGVVTVGIEGRILAAHEEVELLRLRRTSANAAVWERLDRARWQIKPRICYCSVFDECWIAQPRPQKPARVAQCPADWVAYDE